MKSLNRRIEKLEEITPDKDVFKNLGEYLKAENTPGTSEYKAFHKLYDPYRNESE